MKLTETEVKALKIIQERGPIVPRMFAELMWPDSPCWRHHIKCGPKGSHQGGGMYLAAGGYLGKLRVKGLVRQTWRDGYILSKYGEELLKEYCDEN